MSPRRFRLLLAAALGLAIIAGLVVWVAVPLPAALASPGPVPRLVLLDRHGLPLRATRSDEGSRGGWTPLAETLAEIVGTVHTIEIMPELKAQADTIFEHLGYGNIVSHAGDGYFGWPEAAPFDGIVVAAAPEKVPEPLLDQLAEGGRLVIPVGDTFQFLEVFTREHDQIRHERNIAVRFVPMTGTAGEK